jgi:excisionase family DNA binding protein
MIESREVMNVRQASQYLGISPDTLYKYVSEERIPAFKLGNRWKFKKTMLDRWMEKQSEVKEEQPMSVVRRGRIQAARVGRGSDGQR